MEVQSCNLHAEESTLILIHDPYTHSTSGGMRVTAFMDLDIAVHHAESFSVISDMNKLADHLFRYKRVSPHRVLSVCPVDSRNVPLERCFTPTASVVYLFDQGGRV